MMQKKEHCVTNQELSTADKYMTDNEITFSRYKSADSNVD